MVRVRDQRVRIVLVVGLLVVIGYFAYRAGVSIWTTRQYDAASQALERYDYPQAAQHLDRLLAVEPTDPPGLILAAQTARRQGKFDDAARRLSLAAKHGVAREVIAMEERLLALQSGDLSDVERLTQICEEAPAGPEAALLLEAIIEGSLKAFNLRLAKWGIDLWLTHRSKPFDQAQGLLWHGRFSEFMQDLPQATADYQKAAELAPECWPARIRLVESLLRDDPRRAMPHLDALRKDRPNDPEVRFLTARLCREIGQPEEAVASLDAILVADPDNVKFLLERARVAMDLRQGKEAERSLDRALALASDRREVNIAMADFLRFSGRLDEAKTYQDRAQAIEARLDKKLKELTNAEKTKK
jgi:predicted Zn-dependent protease